MKYYAVTDDPRELYHYGRLGMKWGQHIFGDKPKSPAFKNAIKKLKAAKTNVVSKTSKTIKAITPKIKKSAAQAAYNIRAKQQSRFEKSVAKAQSRLDKSNTKFDNYQVDTARKSIEKQINKEAKAINRGINKEIKAANRKEKFNNAVATIQKTANQIVQTKRDIEQNRFNKAVEKAQKRNALSDALRNLDNENKLYKQAERERKMDDLREKHAEIMADNDLKSMQKAVKVEKNMPKYYQQARTGMLPYGKLSDEQIGRLQNRLSLEYSTRRLGSTEAPSWRQQKKAARREGYLQGITKGISAGMEEIGRASVQYGIKNLANRKKLDNASEQKAKREKEANRIKNRKTHSEMREDLRDKAYETQLKEGVHAVQRGAISARQAARQLRYAENKQRERQDAINDAHEERKFLMDERHNAIRDERQAEKKLTEHNRDVDSIGESLANTGYAIVATYDKQGRKNGTKLLDANNPKDSEAKAYLALRNAKKDAEDKAKEANEAKEEPFDFAAALAEAQRKHAQQQEELKRKNDAVNAIIEQRTREQNLKKHRVNNQKRLDKVQSAYDRVETYKRLRQKQRILSADPAASREQIEDNNDAINAILAEIAKERLRKQKAGLK